MKTTAKIIAVFALTSLMATAGCQKENTPGMGVEKGYMVMRMAEEPVGGDTPPPSAYAAVYIDIATVEVHYSDELGGNAGWVALSAKAGVYDLMTLQNNVMAAITEDTPIPVGKITQIRLVLGNNNSVLIGGDGFKALTVPSREIKLNVNTTVAPGKHYAIALAFDAGKSIVVQGNGSLTLKPVIEVKSVVSYQPNP